MRLATCLISGEARVVVADTDGLSVLPPDVQPLAELLIRPAQVIDAVNRRTDYIAIEEGVFLPPVSRPDKILCVGLNYAEHAAESAAERPCYPSLFPRFASSLVGHRQPIVAPTISDEFDFEGELAVVMGRPAWRVDAADAASYIGGYTCFAENSVRDFQTHSRQVTAGKNFVASGAVGPWITTADEVLDLRALTLTTRLNGEIMQHASIGTMLFSVEEMIAYISRFTRLLPGDIIATGTPAGVGARRKPPRWMMPGDVLEIDIPGIGLLSNPVVGEARP